MKIITIVLIGLITSTSFAQVTDGEKQLKATPTDSLQDWKIGGITGLNFSQATFSNWAAGGQNSISLNALFSIFANYKKINNLWENMLDAGYGFLRQGKEGKLIKTDDKIDFTSKYGRLAVKSWYYAALLNFKTQFSTGYNYPNDSDKISDFLAPAYLIEAIGMNYKPDDHFSAFISPATLKTTIVNSTKLADAGAYGVDKASYDAMGMLTSHGKKTKNEFGGYAKLVYSNTIFKEKNISILSKLDLFSNFLHNPQNIDVSWENILGFKVNKYISSTITVHLMYDDDINIAQDKNGDGIMDASGPRTQFKEVLAIGFSYKF